MFARRFVSVCCVFEYNKRKSTKTQKSINQTTKKQNMQTETKQQQITKHKNCKCKNAIFCFFNQSKARLLEFASLSDLKLVKFATCKFAAEFQRRTQKFPFQLSNSKLLCTFHFCTQRKSEPKTDQAKKKAKYN